MLYAEIGVSIWLGPTFDDAGSVVRVTVTPAALFVIYLLLRKHLDAVEIRSYNSRNNLIALAVFGAVAASFLAFDVTSPVFCVAWAFSAGVTTQGALTFSRVHRLFSLRSSDYMLQVALPLGLVTGALGLAARPLVEGSGARSSSAAGVGARARCRLLRAAGARPRGMGRLAVTSASSSVRVSQAPTVAPGSANQLNLRSRRPAAPRTRSRRAVERVTPSILT